MLKSITARIVFMAAILLMASPSFAQFEDMFLEQTQDDIQSGSFAKSGWSGAMNVGSSGVAYTSDYSAVKAALKTPTQTAAYMQENFSYGFDTRVSGFKATDPATVNASRWGSCKEFTVFMADVLSDDGISVEPILIKYGTASGNNQQNHVMSVVSYNGAAYLQSNQDIWQVGSQQQILDIASQNLPGGNARDLKYYPVGYIGEFKY